MLDQLSLFLSDIRTLVVLFLELGAFFVWWDEVIDGFLGSLIILSFTENAIVRLLAKIYWLNIQGERGNLI